MGKAREQINGLRLLILEIGNQWEQLATSMSLAYGKARKSQEEILNGIKPAVEEFAKKKNSGKQEAKQFVLAVFVKLALGPYDPLSSFSEKLSPEFKAITDFGRELAFKLPAKPKPAAPASPTPAKAPTVEMQEWRDNIKNVYEEETRNLALNFKDKLDDEIYGDMVAKIQGWTKSSTPSPGNFLPVGLDPLEYFLEISRGVQHRTNRMSMQVRKWGDDLESRWGNDEYAELVKSVVAEKWEAGFKDSKFFTDAPLPSIDPLTDKFLMSRAKLSLWIAWAQERDKSYWEKQYINSPYVESEAKLWEPLRVELISLGVPLHHVSTFANPPLINFPAFIEWSFSEHAINQLLAGNQLIPPDVERIKNQWIVHLINRQAA